MGACPLTADWVQAWQSTGGIKRRRAFVQVALTAAASPKEAIAHQAPSRGSLPPSPLEPFCFSVVINLGAP